MVVVFTCNHCPVAQAYEDRIVEIAADYKDKGVEVVAINVNNMEADKLPAMKERAEEKGFKFDYLYDPSQEIGRAFGATVTPHAFLLDGERNVVYIGAIDDNMNREQGHEAIICATRSTRCLPAASRKPTPPSRSVAAFGMNDRLATPFHRLRLGDPNARPICLAGCSRTEPARVRTSHRAASK